MARSRTSTSERSRSGEESRAIIPLRWGVALNLAIILLAGVGIGILQAHAHLLVIPAPPAALPLFGAGIVGVLTGLVSRLVLRSWRRVFRFLIAFVVLLAWMAAFHGTYIAWMRIRVSAHFTSANVWILDGQLTIGCLSILAAGLAGRRAHRSAPLGLVYRLLRREPPVVENKAPLHWSLMLSLGMALLLGVGIGTLQANTDRLPAPVPPLVIAVIGAAIMGLLAGITVLLTLPGWTEVLRVQIALLIMLVWLIAAEVTYADWMKLHRADHLAHADNWAEIGLLVVGCMGAIISGLGRRSIPVEIGQASLHRREPTPRRKKRSSAPSGTKIKEREKRQAISVLKPRLSILRRRPRAGENGGVKVIATAEERCPYCLEVVEKKDARGVVVCEICGSPHHADCWEAGGGMCQVPHLIT